MMNSEFLALYLCHHEATAVDDYLACAVEAQVSMRPKEVNSEGNTGDRATVDHNIDRDEGEAVAVVHSLGGHKSHEVAVADDHHGSFDAVDCTAGRNYRGKRLAEAQAHIGEEVVYDEYHKHHWDRSVPFADKVALGHNRHSP